MTAAEGSGPGRTAVMFGNGNRAVLVDGHGADPGEMLAALGLEPGAAGPGVIIVCGGADDLTGESLTRAEPIFGPAVSAAAHVTGAVVFDGGTASGCHGGHRRGAGQAAVARCRSWSVWRLLAWCPIRGARLVVTGSR